MAVGGPVAALSIDKREYKPTADCDVKVVAGGFTNEHASNGDGSTRLLKSISPWKMTGFAVECDNDEGDQESLKAVKNGKRDVDIVITFVDETVYAGTGNVEGELSYSPNNATMEFDLAGPRDMEPI